MLSERLIRLDCRVSSEPFVQMSATVSNLCLMNEDFTPQQVASLLAQDEIQLIDVRQDHENQSARIPGSRLIELASLPEQAGTISADRPVVFYCHSGGRSAAATQAFADAGFDAHNMVGGIVAWAAAGLPLEPDNAVITH